ncbi:MAG: ABC transporter substrate-binding protein, partial [Treponema sp.]|nr:ABC transporter substrate-binding protein [Treponema sp.]
MKKSISLAALLLLAVTVVFAGGKADGDTVKIGAVFALSGPVAFGGIQARAGAQLAVDELNAAGGILGKKVALISEDDEGDPAKSVNAFNKLTTQDKAAFIVGSNISGTTMSMTALAQQRKVVLITPTGTNPKVTDAGDFIFRACFIDPFQGVAA